MKVADVMSTDVIAVAPGTSIKDVARTLAERRISGVPVVTDDGSVVGIVSQSDLMHRAELGTEKRRKWWLHFLADERQLAREFTQAHGQHARDVMARHVVTVTPETSLGVAADMLDQHRIKRMPVVRDGRLVGMLTRGDLVRALAETAEPAAGSVDDAAIHAALYERLRRESWSRGSIIAATVDDGVVSLRGFVESAEQRRALRVLAEEVQGVQRVEDHMTVGLPSMMGV